MTAEEIEEVVRRLVREDDPRALDVLYDAFGPALRGCLMARLRDRWEGEDVLQQLFLDVARKPGQMLGARRLGPWLFAKARNLAIDRMRARVRTEERESRWPAWLEPAAPDDDSAARDAARVAALVDRLPPEQREVVALKVFQDMTFADVGALLGIFHNTAARRYRYALKKLRAWLTAEEGHEP